MHDIKTRTDNLSERLDKLKQSLNLAKKRKDLKILETEAANPNLWDDPQKAKEILQKLTDIKKELEEIDKLSESVNTLVEFSEEGELASDLLKELKKAEEMIEKIELTSFLSGEYDAKNALLSIHAGQGGTEAMDWVSMLYRMYLRFFEKKDWKYEVVDLSEGEEAGLKSVTLKVIGLNTYGFLKNESGTHRLVRQSPFNADNLRQTSFALVEVLPELEEVDLPDIEIKDEDIDLQFFRSSSQGGQNVQKVSTAVRIVHKPTGITVTAQSERFQEQNRKNAMNLLRAKLWKLSQEEALKTKKELKGEYQPASWGTQIRSYVLHPYKMVKDLRTEVETSNTEAVLDGEIGEFIEAELKLK